MPLFEWRVILLRMQAGQVSRHLEASFTAYSRCGSPMPFISCSRTLRWRAGAPVYAPASRCTTGAIASITSQEKQM